MKKYLISLAISLSIATLTAQSNMLLLGVGTAKAPGGGVSPATFVAKCDDQAGSGTTVDCASETNVTNGNTIYLFSDAVLSGSATLTSFTKQAGTATIGSVTLLDNIDRSGGGVIHQVSGYVNVTGSGSLTIRATWSTTVTNTNIHWLEYSGTDTTTPNDQHNYTQDAGGACTNGTNNMPTITTAKNQTVVLSFIADNGTDITALSGTERTHQGAVSAFVYSSVESQTQVSAGSVTPTYTTSAADSCAQMTIGVKANGS